MVISCLGRYNVVSAHLLCRKFVFQNITRLNLANGGKLGFRKHFHFTTIRWSKNEATNIIKDKNSNFGNIKRLFSLAGPEKKKLAAAVGLLVISSSVTMSIPFALGKVIDIIYSMDQLKTIGNLIENRERIPESSMSDHKKQSIMLNLEKVCVVLVGVFMVGAVANFGSVYLMRMISQRVSARIRNSVYSSIGTI